MKHHHHEYKQCSVQHNGHKWPLTSTGVRELVAHANNVYEAAVLITICQFNGKPYRKSMDKLMAESHMGITALRKALNGLIKRKVIARKATKTINNMIAYEYTPLIDVSSYYKLSIPQWILRCDDTGISPVLISKSGKNKRYITFNATNLVYLMLLIDYKGYSGLNLYAEISRLMKTSSLNGNTPINMSTMSRNFNAILKDLVVVQGAPSDLRFIFNDTQAVYLIKKVYASWSNAEREIATDRSNMEQAADKQSTSLESSMFKLSRVDMRDDAKVAAVITNEIEDRPHVSRLDDLRKNVKNPDASVDYNYFASLATQLSRYSNVCFNCDIKPKSGIVFVHKHHNFEIYERLFASSPNDLVVERSGKFCVVYIRVRSNTYLPWAHCAFLIRALHERAIDRCESAEDYADIVSSAQSHNWISKRLRLEMQKPSITLNNAA